MNHLRMLFLSFLLCFLTFIIFKVTYSEAAACNSASEYVVAALFFLHSFLAGYIAFKIKNRNLSGDRYADFFIRVLGFFYLVFSVNFICRPHPEWTCIYIPLSWFLGLLTSPYYLNNFVQKLGRRRTKC